MHIVNEVYTSTLCHLLQRATYFLKFLVLYAAHVVALSASNTSIIFISELLLLLLGIPLL